MKNKPEKRVIKEPKQVIDKIKKCGKVLTSDGDKTTTEGGAFFPLGGPVFDINSIRVMWRSNYTFSLFTLSSQITILWQ